MTKSQLVERLAKAGGVTKKQGRSSNRARPSGERDARRPRRLSVAGGTMTSSAVPNSERPAIASRREAGTPRPDLVGAYSPRVKTRMAMVAKRTTRRATPRVAP